MNAERLLKVSLGFSGGQVLTVRVGADALSAMHSALGGSERWFELALEDGLVQVDLTQVAYVRVVSDEPRVGFGA